MKIKLFVVGMLAVALSIVLTACNQAPNVFLAVSEEEISFWDSASGGKLLAVAKYPETLTGAAEAMESYDFIDLDGDGSKDLTVSFTFADHSTANLVWLSADGGLVYSESLSLLPGGTSVSENMVSAQKVHSVQSTPSLR